MCLLGGRPFGRPPVCRKADRPQNAVWLDMRIFGSLWYPRYPSRSVIRQDTGIPGESRRRNIQSPPGMSALHGHGPLVGCGKYPAILEHLFADMRGLAGGVCRHRFHLWKRDVFPSRCWSSTILKQYHWVDAPPAFFLTVQWLRDLRRPGLWPGRLVVLCRSCPGLPNVYQKEVSKPWGTRASFPDIF